MSRNNLISVHCFGEELGRLGFDEQRNASFFQYNPAYLDSGRYQHLFPRIIRRIPQTQVFDKFGGEAFRSLPPMIADSLPDVFGNLVFKAWLEGVKGTPKQLTALEQLAYVGRRGMGALEYEPAKEVRGARTIDIDAIAGVVEAVLQNKTEAGGDALDDESLINVFKIGTSAGGVRPKILVSEHKNTGRIIPGDLAHSADFNHYLVKLNIDEQLSYSREVIEFIYAQMAGAAGVVMMPSKLIGDRHFATLRFDRQDGEKRHSLTASGLTGFDYRDPSVSSYENLFDLALFLKVPHRDIAQLFRRMVFNLIFCNHDDHLKNHSFMYDRERDGWELAPAYDLTFALNSELQFRKTSRALSLNGKRTEIGLDDILAIATKYTVRNPKGIIRSVSESVAVWEKLAFEMGIPGKIADSIRRGFVEY